jgi:hypothetical protein
MSITQQTNIIMLTYFFLESLGSLGWRPSWSLHRRGRLSNKRVCAFGGACHTWSMRVILTRPAAKALSKQSYENLQPKVRRRWWWGKLWLDLVWSGRFYSDQLFRIIMMGQLWLGHEISKKETVIKPICKLAPPYMSRPIFLRRLTLFVLNLRCQQSDFIRFLTFQILW